MADLSLEVREEEDEVTKSENKQTSSYGTRGSARLSACTTRMRWNSERLICLACVDDVR